MAFLSPPPVPVVFVVSTLHCQCARPRPMPPLASHTRGAMIRARPRKQPPQKIAFQTFLRAGTPGQSSGPGGAGLSDPGGVTDEEAVPRLPMLLMAYRPLPTGSAVPDTRRIISLPITLVRRVM